MVNAGTDNMYHMQLSDSVAPAQYAHQGSGTVWLNGPPVGQCNPGDAQADLELHCPHMTFYLQDKIRIIHNFNDTLHCFSP